MTRTLLVPALAFVAFAQQATPPAFEVASVKVSDPNPQPVVVAGGMRRDVMRGCRRPDPGMVNCTNATLKTLLVQAYEVKNYQIEGPAWLDSGGYDLMAKIPEGVPVQQVPAMFQALLADRFKVVLHKETKLLPAYELTIAKGGPKLKEVDPAEVAAFNAAQQASRGGTGDAPPPPPPPGGAGGRGGPGGRSPQMGTFMISMSGNGARTFRRKMNMSQLVNMLSNQLSRPVLDMTELKGTYDIELSYLADESDPLMSQLRAMPPPPGATGGDAPRPGADADTPIATLFQALQQTLGLKLDAKKSPLEVLVIESANKIPTEN
jgi:uncharacterized protein (TIGR03435 family)